MNLEKSALSSVHLKAGSEGKSIQLSRKHLKRLLKRLLRLKIKSIHYAPP